MRKTLAVVSAAVAMFLLGFVYWGATKLPYSVFERTADDAATARALHDHFRQNGTYSIPDPRDPNAELLARSGPIAIVHVAAAEGGSLFDPKTMVVGFVHELVVAALLLALLAGVGDFRAKLRRLALTALVGVVMIHGGDVVWWGVASSWALVVAAYDFVALLVGGIVVASVAR